jgi:4-amino-4-deoxy-L-arabinose transferase-like glycosyltransferase
VLLKVKERSLAWEDVIIPLALALLPVILFLPFVNEPLDPDAGVYATVARWMMQGQIPYQDLFDHKQPLLYGWYALSFLLFGEEASSPRLLILFHLAATTFLIYACGRLLFRSRAAGYMAALVFGLTPGLTLVTQFGDARFLMLTPLVAGLWAYLMGYRTGARVWYFVSGFFNGLAAATVILAGLNLLALGAFTWAFRRETGGRWLRAIGPLLAGAGLALGLVILPFAAAGALDDMIYANVVYNFEYATNATHHWAALGRSAGSVLLMGGPFFLAAAIGTLLLLRSLRRPEASLLLAWTATCLLSFIAPGRLPYHYLIAIFPALALLAGHALPQIWASRDRPLVRASAMIVVPLLAAAAFANAQPYMDSSGGAPLTHRYSVEEKDRMAHVADAAAYVAKRTAKGEEVLYLGRHAGPFYFYSGRLPAARSILPCVLVDKNLTNEVLAAVRTARPAYVLDALRPEAGCSQTSVRPVLDDLLREGYKYEGRIYFVDVYERLPAPAVQQLYVNPALFSQ